MQNITTSNSAEPFLVYDQVPTQNSILHTTHHRKNTFLAVQRICLPNVTHP